MPSTYKIDQNLNLITFHSVGKVTVDEEIAQVEAIIADPKFKKDMNVIGDLSDALYDWSLNEIDQYRRFVKSVGPQIGKCKWAVIVSAGATQHAAKLFSALQESHDKVVKVKVFNDTKTALSWL